MDSVPLPVSAEFVAVSGFVLLSAFLTVELLRGSQSPARRALAAFTGLVILNRMAYLAALVWALAAAWWHVAEAGLLVTAVCILLFAYAYGGWAYPRERRVVVGLTALAAVVVVTSRVLGLGSGVPRYLFDYQRFVYELPASRTLGPWPFRAPLLAAHIWAAVVLARKGWRPRPGWPAASGEDSPAKLAAGARRLSLVFALGAVMPALEVAEYGGVAPPGLYSALALLLLSLAVVVYTTYAPEPTSLQFRLTAVSLSVVMAVLTLAAGLVGETTERAARASRIEKAETVGGLAERGALRADDLPAGVAYALVRDGAGRQRLVTNRADLSLAQFQADERAEHRPGWALPSAAAVPDTGPHWEAVGPGVPAEWSRGALAPAARRFDAVAVGGGRRLVEVGVPHAVLRAAIGEAVTPLLLLMVLATGLVWAGGPLLFGGSLLRPIARLRAGLAQIEGGALDARIDVESNDEIGSLGRSFNRMAAALGRASEREAAAVRAEAQAEKLRELDAAKSRFFADVSHEFRTPLTLTLGPLDDLKAGLHGPLPGPVAQQVDLARRSAGRVLDLINQILEVARLEAGRVKLKARPLDLGAFVQGLAGSLAPLAERKALSFEVHTPEAPVEVYADPEHLEQVVVNLLSNAIKFTPEGGAVRVTVGASAAHARVAVRDNGPGIPAADLPHVFDRFYRVDESSVRTQPGTGIGLALAKELVDLHGGTLTAESEEGFGSLFTVTLPLGRAHLAPDQVSGEPDVVGWTAEAPEAAWLVPEPGGDGRAVEPVEAEPADVTTVLVVEDNAEVRAYVRRHLERAAPPYRVVEAADGTEGLEVARARLPDLVVSDVLMPGLDGVALCRALRADPATDFIPVILLTAKAGPEDRLEGLREHADDYLTKPFDPSELLARVENLIALRRRLRERFAGASGGMATPARTPSLASPPVASADAAWLERVRAAVEAHLADETFSVERLAEAVGVSRGHLHRQLRALGGQTPTDLIRTMRLERAAQLLAGRAGTVSEVAYAVGFKSVGHFSDRFVDAYGCRPSAYAAHEGTA